MIGLLSIDDEKRGIDLCCLWACEGLLYMKDVVHTDGGWQWARSAGFPAQTKRWDLRMARCIRDPAMDAIVVILFYPYGMQSWGHCRALRVGHLTTCGAKKGLLSRLPESSEQFAWL